MAAGRARATARRRMEARAIGGLAGVVDVVEKGEGALRGGVDELRGVPLERVRRIPRLSSHIAAFCAAAAARTPQPAA